MRTIIEILATIGICSLLTWIAYLQTKLNIVQSQLEDLEFLYDLRK